MSQSFSSNIASPDDLLAEAKWIQSLARALVGNSSSAEDVAQDTLVIALENPPTQVHDRQGLRNWLAGVIRRVASHETRGEARRAYRQQVAAKDSVEASSHDVVERYALQRRVAEGVMEIAEPYRSTLLLYYFDDLSVKAIAEQTNMQIAAIRKRLSRGRELLRELLDREYGEDCRGWLPALVGVPPQRTWKDIAFSPLAIGAAVLAVVAALVISNLEVTAEPELTYARTPEVGEDDVRDIVVASLSQAVPAFERQEDADEIAAKLSEEVGLEFSKVTALEVRKPLKEIRALAKRASVKLSLLSSAELYAVTSRNPTTGKEGEAIVARFFLPEISPEARIVVAVAGKRPIGLGLWGTRELDEDPDQRWGLFANQLLFRGRKSMIGKDAESPADFDKRMAALLADEKDGAFVGALIKQRGFMQANTQYVRGAKMRDEAGSVPSVEWYASLSKGMEEIAGLSSELERVLGEATSEHSRLASETAAKYTEFAAAVEAGEHKRGEELSGELSELCHACHDAVLEGTETKWFDAFDPVAKELDLPRGVFRIGYDLSPALGDDGVLSQRIATALRAGLMYLDALR